MLLLLTKIRHPIMIQPCLRFAGWGLVKICESGYTYFNMTHLRILLVDDHEVVRLGLKSLIERHPGFEVVAEASAAQEAVQKGAGSGA